jgi:chromosome segregation ATPase
MMDTSNFKEMFTSDEVKQLRAELEAANAEIERLLKQASIFNGRFAEDQLQLAAKDDEIAAFESDVDTIAQHNIELQRELAARDLVIQKMREALQKIQLLNTCDDFNGRKMHRIAETALSLQPTTEALDAYVNERLDEMSRAAYPSLYKESE